MFTFIMCFRRPTHSNFLEYEFLHVFKFITPVMHFYKPRFYTPQTLFLFLSEDDCCMQIEILWKNIFYCGTLELF